MHRGQCLNDSVEKGRQKEAWSSSHCPTGSSLLLRDSSRGSPVWGETGSGVRENWTLGPRDKSKALRSLDTMKF